MSVSAAVTSFLNERKAPYVILTHPESSNAMQTAHSAHISPLQLVKSVVLWNGSQYLMALVPAAHMLVINWLNRDRPGRHRLATEAELHMLFDDCEEGAVPGFASAYHLPMLWDFALRESEELYFEGGDHHTLIRMQRDDLIQLLDDADGLTMSCTPDTLEYYQYIH